MYRATVTLPFSKMGFCSPSLGELLLLLSKTLSAEDLQLGLRTIVIEADNNGASLDAYMALRETLLSEKD